MKMIAGETVLGKMMTKNKEGEKIPVTIKFGNFVEPKIDGVYVRQPPEGYEKTLRQFMASEEGADYDYPSARELEEANDIVSEKIRELMEKDAWEEHQEKRKATKPKYLDKNMVPERLREEYADDSEDFLPVEKSVRSGKREKGFFRAKEQEIQKRATALLISTCVLTGVGLLQMLLNLYLFVR